jgi:hypothetical protein
MYARSLHHSATAVQKVGFPSAYAGSALRTAHACECSEILGWDAEQASTVRTGSPLRPEPFSNMAPGLGGCLMNAALREGTIWESPAWWLN